MPSLHVKTGSCPLGELAGVTDLMMDTGAPLNLMYN